MKKLILATLGIALFTLSHAQSEDSLFIRKLANEILINSKAYPNLKVLTKEIGPRLAGSPGMVKSEKWGLRAMIEAKADSAWLQQCMVPHWVRGGKDNATATYNDAKAGARNTAYKTKKLDIIALGNSVGSNKPLTAEVIVVKDFEDLEQKKEEVRGKIVFYNYKFNPTYVRTFQSYGDAVRYRGQGPSRAAKYGAVGTIVRSMSHSTDNYPHTGSTNYNDSFPKIPAVAIGLQDADWLSEKA
ncbi:MAG TPA: peptidase M28 family protein, partial [Chitinophagaceae bacterium]